MGKQLWKQAHTCVQFVNQRDCFAGHQSHLACKGPPMAGHPSIQPASQPTRFASQKGWISEEGAGGDFRSGFTWLAAGAVARWPSLECHIQFAVQTWGLDRVGGVGGQRNSIMRWQRSSRACCRSKGSRGWLTSQAAWRPARKLAAWISRYSQSLQLC